MRYSQKVDSYPHIGRKIRAASFDEVVHLVREKYPDAFAEGCAGLQRTWWNKQGLLVAYSWRSWKSEKYWVRIASTPIAI